MKTLAKIIAALVALVVVVFIGLSIFISTLDADKYRPMIVKQIGEKTGRVAKLNGPIKFSLGLSGVKISVQDASISNPAWASRPTMAGMGKFELAVGVLPLLAHHISINELAIENADILLETNASGQHNWDMGIATPAPAVTQTEKAQPSSSMNGSLAIDNLTIINSQLAMRVADGKTSSYNVQSLKLTMALSGAVLAFKGDANGAPIALNVKTNIHDLLSKSAFTFDADLSYAPFHLTAQGKADAEASKADITAYAINAGATKITGNLAANWGGARPTITGALNSDKITMADFKPAGSDDAPTAAPTAKTDAPASKMIFSPAHLPLDALKSADASFDVSVGEFPQGKGSLKNISAKLSLSNGNLVIAPVKAIAAGAPIDIQVKLNAAQSPAHLMVGIIANGVDLGDLQKLGGMAPFMTGKAGANIQLMGDGNSAHDIAASLGGVITVTAEKGEILTGAAAGISSTLATIFNPQGGDSAINCLAVRFLAKGGVLTDNGILIDSAASTVSGKGNVNLGAETVDLTLHAKTKLVDIGGLVPPVGISGTLKDPHYSIDAVSAVKNVVGGLLNGNMRLSSSGVPDIQVAPAGQNACVYTLDHPQAAASTGILPSTLGGKASQQIQNIGGALHGLFGK